MSLFGCLQSYECVEPYVRPYVVIYIALIVLVMFTFLCDHYEDIVASSWWGRSC